MKYWLARTQLRQRPMLAVSGGLLILVTIGIGTAILLWPTGSDRVAVIANLLAFGTLLLALVAGIVALAAYSAATGLPNLWLKINEPFALFIEPPTRPIKITFVSDNTRRPTALSLEDNFLRLAVRNSTKYAARTPAVIIEFDGAAIRQDMYGVSNDWTATSRDTRTRDVLALQWDGGPNYAIHGNSTRHLPEVNLQGLYSDPTYQRTEMVISLLADGYSRKEIRLAIRFVTEDLKPPIMAAYTWM